MEHLPIELQNKIIFPKYYKLNNSNITLNEKIIIGNNFNKLRMVTQQLDSLFEEYVYKKNNSNFDVIKQSKFVRFILMKNLSKKKFKSSKQTAQIYNTFNNICSNTCNNYLNTNNTIYLNTNNINTNNINYNYFNSITTYLN
tara:strand:+ start:48 stop:473 length:426 start_codon:yes stop_codon:yes gene_type:complete